MATTRTWAAPYCSLQQPHHNEWPSRKGIDAGLGGILSILRHDKKPSARPAKPAQGADEGTLPGPRMLRDSP